MFPKLSTHQEESLAWFMHWGRKHIDESGRRQYPNPSTLTATFGVWIVDALFKKGYLSYETGEVQPTPQAERWWMERQGTRRRQVLKLDK